ncbi:heparinase II/III domain-containing protein [Micrococcus terreus]|uniref:heparinase II/III domain-containing protein n=1 Tax=Micrococcus terreus TaxID=574650 RepID=UPI0025502B5C|nr:heparinase II/III family protein [Micrococcus terreus]MDK7700993.1 heparinase II/III family protein [Micrococcus terreus]WOO98020.1 heparinase II/III family protein [Micrococcus terreus]
MDPLDYLHRAPLMVSMQETRTRFLTRQEILAGGEHLPLEGDMVWRHRRTRSLARHLHAWDFYYHLRPFGEDRDRQVLDQLIQVLGEWRAVVGLPPTRIPMSYHDETTAQRTIALTCLLQDYDELLTSGQRDTVLQVIREGAGLLASEEFHSTGTNHGMYQDLALLVASPYLEEGESTADLAHTRLTEYFATAFTEDGIHREQSPEYHCLVTTSMRRYIDLIENDRPETAAHLRRLLEPADLYATMSISPMGTFAPVSDVTSTPVLAIEYARAFSSEPYRFAVTQGAQGTAPTVTQLIAEDTGVAVYRADWQDPDSLYLYVSAAYNADYHKHSDDLSVYLVHRGLELLREAGPNGYQMEDPYTVYAFSSFAHNTLIVDGEGLPRIEPNAQDKVGLVSRPTTVDTPFAVRGHQHRFPGVEHQRQVTVHRPTAEGTATVRIADTVSSADRHDYDLLWHLGPEVIAETDGTTIRLTDRHGAAVATMTITSDTELALTVVQGQTEPQIQGWYFPQMGRPMPAQTVIVSLSASDATVRTDIDLR